MRLKELRQEQYENEKRQVPVDILMRLADYYDVSVDCLLGRADI